VRRVVVVDTERDLQPVSVDGHVEQRRGEAAVVGHRVGRARDGVDQERQAAVGRPDLHGLLGTVGPERAGGAHHGLVVAIAVEVGVEHVGVDLEPGERGLVEECALAGRDADRGGRRLGQGVGAGDAGLGDGREVEPTDLVGGRRVGGRRGRGPGGLGVPGDGDDGGEDAEGEEREGGAAGAGGGAHDRRTIPNVV
jgi:hypothetical protein